MNRLWKRLPVLLRAIVLGLVIQLAASLWIMLLLANARFDPTAPWAALAMAVILLAFWAYAGGTGWPSATKEFRRDSRRTAKLAKGIAGLAFVAAASGQASLVAFGSAAALYFRLPAPNLPDLSVFAPATLVVLFFAWSLTAGVVEETAFRGYMQRMIERRHGAVVAILVTSTVFAIVHFSTALQMLPLIFLASTVYGVVARLSGSIVPGIAVHTLGNLASFLWAYFPMLQHRANPPVASEDPAFFAALGIGAVAGMAFAACVIRLKRRQESASRHSA